MDYKLLLASLPKILLNPVAAWEIIDTENRPVKALRDTLLLPLIILVSISAVAGSLIFANNELSPVYSIFTGLRTFILLYLTIYVSALILGEITFPLDLGRNFSISFRLIAFSLTPFLICQIMSRIFESLLFVNILGLYGLYLFWTGAEKLLSPPQYKKMPLLISATITIVVTYIGSNALLKILLDKIFYAFFS